MSSSNEVQKKQALSFTDAMIMTGFGKFNYLMTFLCGLMAISLNLEVLGFSFIISSSQCDLNLSISDKGILGAISLIGLLCSSNVWGYLADTKGRRRILMVSMLSTFICSIISSLSPNFITLLILKWCSSALISSIYAVMFAYYGEMTPKTYADMMISLMTSIFGGGFLIATGVAWGILNLEFNIPFPYLGIVYKPWRFLVICYTLPLIVATIGLYWMPESPKYLMSIGRSDQVLQILKKIYVMNSRKDVSTYMVDDILIDDQDNISEGDGQKSLFCSIWSQVGPIFRPPLLINSLIIFTIAVGTIGSVSPFFVWLPDFVDRFYVASENDQVAEKVYCEMLNVRTEIRNRLASNTTLDPEVCNDTLNTSSYPFILLINVIIITVNLIVTFLLKWISKKHVIIYLLGTSCVSSFLLNFIYHHYISWLLMVLYQFTGPVLGIINAYVVELFPTQYRATATSFMLLFGRIGGVVYTNMYGLLVEYECSIIFYACSGLLLVCTLVSFMLPNSNEKQVTTPTSVKV